MKTIAALTLSLLALASVQTQVLHADAVNGAIVGGIAGAIIGNNSGDHNALRGAAIGSVAGALIGSASDNSHSHGYYARPPLRVGVGYYSGSGYGHGYHGYRNSYGYGAYGYVAPVAYYSDYGYRRPSYASSGMFWGGITGAIIGNNSYRHNAWRGAALGAGAGLLIGAIADQDAREREERAAAILDAQSAAAAQNATAVQPAPQNVTIINNYNAPASTPMSSANGMFGR